MNGVRTGVRVTVCELPLPGRGLEEAWQALCTHVHAQGSDVVVLPEFAFAEPVWERQAFDRQVWEAQVAQCDAWLQRLPELGVWQVIGARPVTRGGRPFNAGFRWSRDAGDQLLRCKHYLPDEPGGWEAQWFAPGGAGFEVFGAGALRFGLNICTELWALETHARYAVQGVDAIVTPRATAAATIEKWLAAGRVAAVCAGAYGISSNLVEASGAYGGTGWIIDPDGHTLALTSGQAPFATATLDLSRVASARATYPRYVFASAHAAAAHCLR